MSNWKESEYILGHKQWLLDAGLFFLRVQDNGEGVYNWLASPAIGEEEKKHFKESFSVAQGCSDDPLKARLEAIEALGKLMDDSLSILYNATVEDGHE